MPSKPREFAAILVAAGRGRRFGAGDPKQFRTLDEKPLWAHGLSLLLGCPEVGRAVVVVPPGYEEAIAGKAVRLAAEAGSPPVEVTVVGGGATRQESVRAGLLPLETDPPGWVLVHDAARPWASVELLRRVVAAAREHGSAVPGVARADTLVRADTEGWLVEALPRELCYAVQTPQAFRFATLLEAHVKGAGRDATDDGTLVHEVLGRAVLVVPGEPENRKVSRPGDLEG